MLVSIIIPVYNSDEYIERCLESCLSQSFSDIELIVVDDGSTDKSYELACNLAGKDSRLHLYRQNNSGASAARNKGLEVANGEYVVFVDSDDWIDQEMIGTMVDIVMKHPDVQVVQTQEPGEMKHQEREGIYCSKEAIASLLEGSWWGSVCKLIKIDIAKRVRFPIKTISEDYLFNYCLFSDIDALYYIDHSYYHWTVHQDSLSKSKLNKRKFDEFYNVYSVSNMVTVDCPENQQLADMHLAGTCLKLLFMVFHNHAESMFPEEFRDLLHCIRKKYRSFLRNPLIPNNERILLCACFFKQTARIAERLYHTLK